jgi:hypothetical protein
MSDYRAYIFGKDGHRFTHVAEFWSDYPDDAAAMKAAEHLNYGHDIELWERGRLVAKFSHSPLRTKTTLRNFTFEYILRTMQGCLKGPPPAGRSTIY